MSEHAASAEEPEDVSANGVASFTAAAERMASLLSDLESAPRHRVAAHPAVPDVAGIYLFHEGARPIDVGQSRKLRTRLKQHTGATRGRDQASLAFNMAKREAAKAG